MKPEKQKLSFWTKVRKYTYLLLITLGIILTTYVSSVAIIHDATTKENSTGYCTSSEAYVPAYHHHYQSDVVYVVLLVVLGIGLLGLRKYHHWTYKAAILLLVYVVGVGIFISYISRLDLLGSIGCLPF